MIFWLILAGVLGLFLGAATGIALMARESGRTPGEVLANLFERFTR